MSSLVALRDLDGLPGASNLPYFFFVDFEESVPFVETEMLEDILELLLIVWKQIMITD